MTTIGRLPRDNAIAALKEAATVVRLELSHPYDKLDYGSWVIFTDLPDSVSGPRRKWILDGLFGDTPAFANLGWLCTSIPTDKYLQTEKLPAWLETYYVKFGANGLRLTRLDILVEKKMIDKLQAEIMSKQQHLAMQEKEMKERQEKLQELLQQL